MKTDEQIRNDVLDELDFAPEVQSKAIGVTVHDGVVTLAGHVPDYWQKYAAERVTRRVKGVRALVQDIDVQLEGRRLVNDEEIARRASSIMDWSVTAPKEDVEVRVDDGWVTLRGEVGWAFQRANAEQAVRHLAGVKGVVNDITVKNEHQAQDIGLRIQSAFGRNADLDAAHVKVAVNGHAVTLTGQVQTFRERQVAERAAWGAPGVDKVVDQIVVV